jgi:hypothetical protein
MFWSSIYSGILLQAKYLIDRLRNINESEYVATFKTESYESATASDVVVTASKEIIVYFVGKSNTWQAII